MTEPAGGRAVGLGSFVMTCLRIGIVGFGGGYAVLELIRSEMVRTHRWVAADEFDDLLAAVQLVPGPTTVNLLGALGQQLAGWGGLLLGTVAVVAPSFVIVAAVAAVYLQYAQAPSVVGAMAGLAAAVIGLMLAVTVDLAHDVRRDILHGLIVAGAFVVVAFTSIDPIFVIIAAIAVGGIQVALHRG